jgi:UDP-2,3-diacylglucosamine pyrophosphatase LpxH
MKYKEFLKSFDELIASSPSEDLGEGAHYVFMSDLHLGDGGRRDDLRRNRALVLETLARWYGEKDYTLVLNGDIEDVSKFPLRDIRRAWSGFFGILDDFAARGKLRKIVGNHDLALLREREYPYPLLHGLSLGWEGKRIFAFHGHQASRFFVNYDYLSDFLVRYLAKPLRIKNTGISSDSSRRFKAERRIYRASKRLGLVSITGHTHRPLFESLSKYESLIWAIEDKLREYAAADGEGKKDIAEVFALYRAELRRLTEEGEKYSLSRSLYEDRDILIPCLFNSGCATGKKGYTAIEIIGRSIELVHWGSAEKCRRYLAEGAIESEALEGSDWTRYVIRRDSLDRVFARIELIGADHDEDDEAEAAIALAAMSATANPLL